MSQESEDPLRDLKDRVGKFSTTCDSAEQVNAFCDDLYTDILMLHDSYQKHLKDECDLLIEQLNTYRAERLNIIETKPFTDSLKATKQNLTEKIEELEKLPNPLVGANALCLNISLLSSELKRHAIGSLRFAADSMFTTSNEHIGELTACKTFRQVSDVNAVFLQEMDVLALTNPKDADITDVLFLPDETLLTLSPSEISWWSSTTGKHLGKLEDVSTSFNTLGSLIFLPEYSLICASSGESILVWEMREKKLLRTLSKHTARITALSTLSEGKRLASLSVDSKIQIWDPNESEPVKTLAGSGYGLGLGQLSNGYLVSYSIDENDVIKIWNPSEQPCKELVTTILQKASDVKFLRVLSNDKLALGLVSGTVRIISLIDPDKPKTMKDGFSTGIDSLVELENGCILGMSKFDPSCLRVWNPETEDSIMTIRTGLKDCGYLAISKSGKFIASTQKGIKLWSLAFKYH